MKVLISAAEMSSDQHAAIVARALLELRGSQVELIGIGGPYLRKLPQFRCIEKAENLRAMGLTEVLQKIRFIRSTLDRLVQTVAEESPDLILTLDYPEFHLAFMKRLHERGLARDALKVCGIPPKVWVWRSRRVEKIRKYYDGVWSIFPFEKSYYESHGIPVIEEGNPLIWNLLQQKKAPVIPSHAEQEIITVMPGSRDSEWRHLLPLIPETLQQFSARIAKPVLALVPIPIGLEEEPLRSQLKSTERVEYRLLPGGTAQALASSRVGLIKSGTSTLEAVMLGCAPVIFYRMNPMSEKFFEFIMRYTGPVGLPNILLGIRDRARSVFPELLGREATPKALSIALQKVWSTDLSVSVSRVQMQMRAGGEVPKKIAAQILEWIERRPVASRPVPIRPAIALGSWLWSSINWIRRKAVLLGWKKQIQFSIPSLLVGNLQAGGSGKTPVVIAMAREAVRRGLKIAIVSRGYGRTSKDPMITIPFQKGLVAADVGDEPLEVLSAVPEAYGAIGADRPAVVDRLIRAVQSRGESLDLLILDDGFQNLSFRVDVTVLLKTPLRFYQTLYRDFENQSRYADLLIENPGPQLQWEPEFLPTQPIWLVCGVANPQRLVDFYERRGVKIDRLIALPDHYPYQADEVRGWIQESKSQGRKIFVTEKDAVKWRSFSVMDSVGILRIKMKDTAWLNEVFDRLIKSK
jgi:lipid-A-disaccharide synthase